MKTFNEWFLSLPEKQQEILRADKWILASTAYRAGINLALNEIEKKLDNEIEKRLNNETTTRR